MSKTKRSMLLLSTKLQANIVSKYELLAEKQSQLEKLINNISLLTKMKAILVQKITSGGRNVRVKEGQDNQVLQKSWRKVV